jgi:hypothetical protein
VRVYRSPERERRDKWKKEINSMKPHFAKQTQKSVSLYPASLYSFSLFSLCVLWKLCGKEHFLPNEPKNLNAVRYPLNAILPNKPNSKIANSLHKKD